MPLARRHKRRRGRRRGERWRPVEPQHNSGRHGEAGVVIEREGAAAVDEGVLARARARGAVGEEAGAALQPDRGAPAASRGRGGGLFGRVTQPGPGGSARLRAVRTLPGRPAAGAWPRRGFRSRNPLKADQWGCGGDWGGSAG